MCAENEGLKPQTSVCNFLGWLASPYGHLFFPLLADVPTGAAQAHLQSAAGRDHAGGQERGAETDG